MIDVHRLPMSTSYNLNPWIWYLGTEQVFIYIRQFLLATSCVLISEDDLPCKFYVELIKCTALENNYHDRECAFLIIRWGTVSYLCFWRILKVRLKMFQLFWLPDSNSGGDKIDSSLWLSVTKSFSSTCWQAAVGD